MCSELLDTYPTLSESLKEKARMELNEDPIERYEKIRELRNWVCQNKEIYSNADTVFIVAHLRVSKFNVEKAKNRITNFYKKKECLQDLFKSRDPLNEKLQHVIKSRTNGLALHNHPDTGCPILIAKGTYYSPEMLDFYDCQKFQSFALDAILLTDEAQINGLMIVLDGRDINFTILKYCTPSYIKALVSIGLKGVPIRFGGIVAINVPAYVRPLVQLTRLLLPTKLNRRIQVLGSDLSELHKFIPPECLPEEYGGTAGTWMACTSNLEKAILPARDYILEADQKYAVIH